MQKIIKMQMQINKLFSLLQEGKYKNRHSLEGKIEKLCNELKIEKERYNKEIVKFMTAAAGLTDFPSAEASSSPRFPSYWNVVTVMLPIRFNFRVVSK